VIELAESVTHDGDLAASEADGRDQFEGVDVGALLARLPQHRVLLSGLAMVVVALAWRIEFLSHLYFRLDDFIDLDLAIQSPFSWKYLTFNGVGHLIIGVRAIGWLLARTSVYNWPLDSAVNLVLVTLSGLAALRLLRTLFGDRFAILIPLGIYLFCPLTMPGLGEWSSALETVPLQLAIFMALDSQVRYLRTGRRRRYFGFALAWVVFALLFFEKGLVLPPLIFLITAAYFADGKSWLHGMRVTLQRYWRDWLVYVVLIAAYGYVLAQSLKTSRVQPSTPGSASAVWHVTWGLAVKTFLTGAFGGPLRWLGGSTYALALPTSKLVVVSLVAAVAVIAVSIWFRPKAWRAWSILGGWILVADVFPIVIGRVNNYPLNLLASETRYVADAVPILAICVGLAFLPLSEADEAADAARQQSRLTASVAQLSQYAVGGLIAVVLFASIWSVQTYENATSSKVAATYIKNATQALALVPAGTWVVNTPAPPTLILNHNGTYVYVSQFVGDIERDHVGHQVFWVGLPRGTINSLEIFGANGRLYAAKVTGAKSFPVPPSARRAGCWPEHDGQIVINMAAPAPSAIATLRLGYIWLPKTSGEITVLYGGTAEVIAVRHGLNSAYMPVSGTAPSVAVTDPSGGGLCIGDVEVGALAPNKQVPALPPLG
jgi:hypothetical protein